MHGALKKRLQRRNSQFFAGRGVLAPAPAAKKLRTRHFSGRAIFFSPFYSDSIHIRLWVDTGIDRYKQDAHALHVTSRCVCMSSLYCERKGWTREGLICKCGEGCGYLFAKIAIVSFLSIIYKSYGLYCRMAGTRSSPTLFFIRVESRDREVEIKSRE